MKTKLYSVNPEPVHIEHGPHRISTEVPGKAKDQIASFLLIADVPAQVFKGNTDGKGHPKNVKLTTGGEAVAKDLATTYRPLGLFVIPEGGSLKDEAAKATEQLIKRWKYEANRADGFWVKSHDRAKISTLAIAAAKHMGLKREWYDPIGGEDVRPAATKQSGLAPCPNCKADIRQGALQCPSCRFVLDQKGFDALKAKAAAGKVWTGDSADA